MKADLTRDTFNPLKHFTRVLMQQGRVQLDADWNEQAAILLHYLQALAADLIGPHGGPDLGFEVMIAHLSAVAAPLPNDFVIAPGRYYVDGILCELEATAIPATALAAPLQVQLQVSTTRLDDRDLLTGQYVEIFSAPAPPAEPMIAKLVSVDPIRGVLTFGPSVILPAAPLMVRRAMTYLTQPDLPSATPLANATSYVVYLDAWERHLTALEDDTVREVALGGPDTATRAKVVWQVKAVAPPAGAPAPTCANAPDLLATLQPAHRGRLRAGTTATTASANPCIIPPASAYRGLENQLYRVEIHTGGLVWDGKTPLDQLDTLHTPPATFKWSRDNGSVVFPILDGGGTNVLTLEHVGRDGRFGVVENDWVEIQDDDSALTGRVSKLVQVQSVDRVGMTVTLVDTPDPTIGKDQTRHPILRRWDLRASMLSAGTDGAALVAEADDDHWLVLEDGVQIQFAKADPAAPNQYRTGDYWLIPARTATGHVEWPTEEGKDTSGTTVTAQAALPPVGAQHHYAPLAVVNVDGTGTLTVPAGQQCRLTIKAATS
jgi:hypothetical protein